METRGIVAADLNQNGVLDLAIGQSGNISVLLGNGDGAFQTASELPIRGAYNGGNPAGIVAADFNADALPDLASVSLVYNDDLSILLGTGKGAFAEEKNSRLAAGLTISWPSTTTGTEQPTWPWPATRASSCSPARATAPLPLGPPAIRFQLDVRRHRGPQRRRSRGLHPGQLLRRQDLRSARPERRYVDSGRFRLGLGGRVFRGAGRPQRRWPSGPGGRPLPDQLHSRRPRARRRAIRTAHVLRSLHHHRVPATLGRSRQRRSLLYSTRKTFALWKTPRSRTTLQPTSTLGTRHTSPGRFTPLRLGGVRRAAESSREMKR